MMQFPRYSLGKNSKVLSIYTYATVKIKIELELQSLWYACYSLKL